MAPFFYLKDSEMSESTDLVVIEKANALTVFKSADQIEEIIQKVEREVMSFVPDVTTAKGRKEIASLAYRVSQTKSYLDGLGKDLVAELKEVPKLIDANRKTVRDRLDELRDKARQPVTDWEAEQARIKAEEEARIAAEKLAAQIESDHEIALLMDEKIDRERAEAAVVAERQRIAHEEEIRRQAAEQARIEAEQAAQRERDAAAKREADLQAAKEKAEADAKAAQERAEREKREAAELAERQRIEAAQRAEREKQEAIEAERRKAESAESARKAEEKRIADEAAERAANEAHRKAIGAAVVNALIAHAGLSRDDAIKTLVALKDDLIPHTSITY